MKAAIYRRYGPPDVVRIEDVEKPVPGRDEILVRVRATTICAMDWRLRAGTPRFFTGIFNGFFRPRKINILGVEFAGTIEAVGKTVTRFATGDNLFGSAGLRFGAHAEYVCLREAALVALKPDAVTFEQAAAIPFGGISALHFLKRGGIGAGQRVLVYGASGSVGTYAVQLAKHFGAHVTAVCSSANLELVTSLGADDVIDYTKEQFWRRGRVYDMVFDAVGKCRVSRGVRALKRGGCFVTVGLQIFGSLWNSAKGGARVVQGMGRGTSQDLAFLVDLVAAGKIKPVIDRRYPIDQIVDAYRYVDTGRKKGNVVIVV